VVKEFAEILVDNVKVANRAGIALNSQWHGRVSLFKHSGQLFLERSTVAKRGSEELENQKSLQKSNRSAARFAVEI